MKIAVTLTLGLVALVSAQNVTNTPTPAPTPLPTEFPTPSGPFEFEPWGFTNFGYHYQDDYLRTYQHAIRRPGWSWDEPLQGYAPFCYNQTCYDVSAACTQLSGTVLHESYCSFPEDVKIAGPSCWDDDCRAAGKDTCDFVGGITVGGGDVEWCLFKGKQTIFGPACYNGVCYEQELQTTCASLGGVVWNRHYCIIPDYYTVVGPVCWRSACFSSTQNICNSIGGTGFKWWCLVKGCDKTVFGPTCSMIPEFDDQCFEDDTLDVCKELGGTQFAQRFCLIEGTEWTFVGPNGFNDDPRINDSRRYCREVKGNVGEPFVNLESYDIGGWFCLVKKRIPPVAPYCLGGTCMPHNSTAFCEKNGGKEFGPYMCTLPSDYRRVEGPLVWNDQYLPSSAPECDGMFCAIPEPNPGENLRCPTAPPFDAGSSPNGGGGNGGGGDGGGGSFAVAAKTGGWTFLICLFVTLW